MYDCVYMHARLHTCGLLFLLLQVQFLYHFINIFHRNLQIDVAIDFYIWIRSSFQMNNKRNTKRFPDFTLGRFGSKLVVHVLWGQMNVLIDWGIIALDPRLLPCQCQRIYQTVSQSFVFLSTTGKRLLISLPQTATKISLQSKQPLICKHPGPVSISITRLMVRSREVSKPRDWYQNCPIALKFWQAPRQHCCWGACQISER